MNTSMRRVVRWSSAAAVIAGLALAAVKAGGSEGDPDPTYQAYLDWGDADYTQTTIYTGPGPDWFLGAEKTGGDWTPDGWLSLNAANAPALLIHLDRTRLTNNLAFVQFAQGNAAGDLRADLLDELGDPLALDVLGNLLDLDAPVHIPLAGNPGAATLRLRHAAGETLIHTTHLYRDDDLDGLAAEEEAALGTSDHDPDTDGDGYTDLYESLAGADPLDPADHPASALTLTVPPDTTIEYGQSTAPSATGQAVACQNTGQPVTVTYSDTVVDTATGLPTQSSPQWPWAYDLTLAPHNQNLDGLGGDDWYDTAAPPVSGGLATGSAGLFYRGDYMGSIWRLGLANGNYTVEFSANVQTNGTEGALGSLGFLGEKPSDANQGLRLNIKRHGQTVSNGSTVTQTLGAHDNTDAFHAFRVARIAPGRYELWRDGHRLATAPLAGTNNGNDDGTFLGAFSSSLSGGWQLDWLRLTPGAYAPDVPVSRTILRTWSAATASAVQRIVIQDTTPPTLVCPADITIPFDASTAPANTGVATAFDLLDPSPVVTPADRDYRTGLEAILALEERDGYFRSLAGSDRSFQGTATSVTGRIGQAVELNGSGALVSSANALPAVRAVSLWFRTTSTAQAMLYSVEGAVFAYIKNGQLQPVFDGSSAGDPWWGTGLNNGQWHHYLAQNDGANTVLYVDGALLGSRVETPANLANWNRASALGGQYDAQSYRYSGALDDVAFYSRTLSAAEIAALAGGSATVVLERSWTATDASGNTASGVQAITRTGAQADEDQDGLTNRDEEILGTDAKDSDTDDDGVDDGVEVQIGSNPKEADADSFTLAAAHMLPPVTATGSFSYFGMNPASGEVELNGVDGVSLVGSRILDAHGYTSGTQTYVTLWRPSPKILELIFDAYGRTDGEPMRLMGGMTLKHGHFVGLPQMKSGEYAEGNVSRPSATNLTWDILCKPYPNPPFATNAPNRGWTIWQIAYEPHPYINVVFDQLPEETESPPHEEDPGGLLAVNNDNDDGEEGVDKDREATKPELAQADPDLKKAMLELDPLASTGTVTLCVSDNIRVWKTATKGVLTTNQWNLAIPAEQEAFKSLLASGIWLEGMESGDGELKLSYDGLCEDKVKMSVLRVGMTAYRPTTELPAYGNPFAKHEVPEAQEETPGAGIRINGDTESGANENDLIEVELKAEPYPTPSGLTYVLKRQNSSIKVWDSQTMGTAILDSGTEATITFSAATKTVWVENPSGGSADLEFIARSGTTDICFDKVHFYPFTSIVIALGGETQNPSDPANAGHGIFQLAIRLYEQGYDVHMYDEDAVDYGGAGVTYNEIVSAVQHRNINRVTIYGYSHGGGSTFVLANLLNNNRGAIGTFTIPFTAYIDAVEDDDLWDPQQEHRRPPSSGFHLNYYQEGHIADGDYGLDGGPMIPPMPPGEGFEDNVDQPTPTETHGTIDDEPTILNDIETGLTSRVAR